MTLSNSPDYLSDEEWNEMVALKDTIRINPFAVTPDAMERFTSLLVRSLYGKGDTLNNSKDFNFMKEHNSDFNAPLEELDANEPAIADRSKRHHPGTPFEEYCSLNPDASECRVYDD